jgi:uncharacterized membrane protein YidH (DUF202 family)
LSIALYSKTNECSIQSRRARDRYRLRLHRARSVVLTPEELVEIRAAQRTFEGAYIRTSLSQFSFALVVLKIFTSEFYSIGKFVTPSFGTFHLGLGLVYLNNNSADIIKTLLRCIVCRVWRGRARRKRVQAHAGQQTILQ